jgi:CIC family chloride channel protein
MTDAPDPGKLTPWRASLGRWAARIPQQEQRLFLILNLVIGAVVGLVVVAFILLTGRLGSRMYPAGGEAWRRLLVPTLGSWITGYLLYRYFPDARGSGIPQTKTALFVHGGYIRLRTVLGKFLCCSASLASGIPLGREGPSVHIGAGIASVLGRYFGLSQERVRALVPAGATAALAAAFNTPIAAVLFSLEEIMGDLNAPVLGSVVLSSATSWMVLHLLLGDEPLFHVPGYRLVSPVEFGVYAVLGVAGGLSSVCFVKLLLGLRARFLRAPRWTVWLQPVAGGLLVGVLGWFVPQVLGVGYNYVEQALNGDMTLQLLALLALLKIAATAAAYASGNAGGIFGPSLFIGAMIGGAAGNVAHRLMPAHTATAGAYALVGMGAAFAGIIRTPLTSVIMIFEVTRDYTIIVPLMISNLVSFLISYRLQPEPLYEALARQDGIHLPSARVRNQAGAIPVLQAMRSSPEVFSPEMTVAEARERARCEQWNAWPVADAGGFRGIITRAQLKRAVAEGRREEKLQQVLEMRLPQGHVAASDFPHVHPDHPLYLALGRMGAAGLNVLPVVSRANVAELLGVVTLRDVLDAYGIDAPPLPSDGRE